MFSYNWVAGDIIALAFTYGVILSILKFLEESAKMELFDLNVLRKLCHVMIGLTLMLCWPLFSSGRTGAILASLIPGLVTTRGLIVGLGMGKDEKIIRSLSRYRNSRELLKATMGYVSTITLATAIYWRTSPAAIAAICNLCAGDGIADIAGRRFGSWKLPYNRNKSIVGTTAMATCGFLASLGPLTSSSDSLHRYKFGRQLEGKPRRTIRRTLTSSVAMFAENPVVSDVIATMLSGGIALSLLRLWEETAKRGLFDQKLNRKLVHVSVGLAFMLCWPMFSSGRQGAIIASLVPAVNIIKMLLLGLGIWKDYATVKSMSRFGDHRELLKGPLYYASTITLAGAIYWRTSPIAIAAICNLCAGDGIADIVGRRFGSHKLPYNRNKSIVGSIAMATAGFLACIGYMHYFSSFGYVQESPKMVLGFLVVSLAASLVESHPLSTELDDNLTVPLASVLVGSFVF